MPDPQADPGFYDRWGVDPGAANAVAAPNGALTPDEFNKKWGLDDQKAEPKERGVVDKLLGRGGERYQLFPERLARGIASDAASFLTLWGDVAGGRVDPGSDEAFNRMMPGAMAITPGLRVGAGAANQLLAPARVPLTEVSPETARLAKTAIEQYGIPIRGGQMAESRMAKTADSVLANSPFSGYGKNISEQHTAFNRAIAKSFGEDADAVTPEVMAAARKRIGNKFDEIAGRTSIQLDDKLKTDFHSILSDATTVLPEQEVKPIFNQLMSVASKSDKDGYISGDTYQALTRKNTPLDRARNSADPNIRFYASQIVDSLRDALERSARPRDVRELKDARKQWASMKTVEDLAEKAPTGDISPALLLGKVRSSVGNFAYGGGGELGDLARIGQRFMKEPPNSGTADRLWWMHALGMGGAGGGLGTMAFYDPMMAAKATGGAVLGAGLNRLTGQYMKSPGYANRLIQNTLVPQAQPSLARQMLPYAPAALLDYKSAVP